ncbi:MAG: hypothetical protein M3460_10470 [Actinomycetota bacterium]|nr:hypothetical protein [Actinomycetota bacterium]
MRPTLGCAGWCPAHSLPAASIACARACTSWPTSWCRTFSKPGQYGSRCGPRPTAAADGDQRDSRDCRGRPGAVPRLGDAALGLAVLIVTGQAASSEQAWGEFAGFLRGLIAAKRADPGEDLLSVLITVHYTGDGRLSDDELLTTAGAFSPPGT